MELRRIERTRLRVPALGRGCAAIGNPHRRVGEADAALFRPVELAQPVLGVFHSRTVNRFSSSINSGSVPLCARMPGMILFLTPMPRAST